VITDATAAPRRYVLRASSPAGGGRTSSCLPILISLADTCAPPAPYGAGADTQAASHERTESWPCRGASPIWFGLTGFTSRATLHKSCAPNGRGAYRKELLRSKGVGARAAAAAAAANSRSSSSSGKIDRERVIDRRRGRRQKRPSIAVEPSFSLTPIRHVVIVVVNVSTRVVVCRARLVVSSCPALFGASEQQRRYRPRQQQQRRRQ